MLMCFFASLRQKVAGKTSQHEIFRLSRQKMPDTCESTRSEFSLQANFHWKSAGDLLETL
jgi:hypothetical protein